MIVFGLGLKKEVLQLRARECLIYTVLRITVLIAPILPIHSMTLLTLMSIDLCHPHTCPSRVPAAVEASYFNVTAIKMAPVDFSLLTYFAFWCVKRISYSYLFLAVTLENLWVAHTFICLPGTWEITTTTSKIKMLPMPLVDRILQWQSQRPSWPLVVYMRSSCGLLLMPASPQQLQRLTSLRWFLREFAQLVRMLHLYSPLPRVVLRSARLWKLLSLHLRQSLEHLSTERKSLSTNGCAWFLSLVAYV